MSDTTEKLPMRLEVDLDWGTRFCPCGASICSRYESDEAWEDFVRKHYSHTNGKEVEHCTDSGATVFSSRPPDRTIPLRTPTQDLGGADAERPDRSGP